MTKTIHEQKNIARNQIIDCSFIEDQQFILNRWINTFLCDEDPTHGQEHQNACLMIKFTLAAIAKGDFRVKFFSKDPYNRLPPDVFYITDYISHASRVLIDLSNLSKENQNKVLSILDSNKMEARPSTHYIEYRHGRYTEIKSAMHGLKELSKGLIFEIGEKTFLNKVVEGTVFQGPELTDFGINIQMGGFGQLNLSGSYSQFGFDGHIFLHQHPSKKAILVGLEQSSPSIQRTKENVATELDSSVGLSGEHSITGASDDYTSAGSLYFSNLIYKLKLYTETGCWTPEKYDAMHIYISESNIDEILTYFERLKTSNATKLYDLLSIKPEQTETVYLSNKQVIENISDSDIEMLFKQLKSVGAISTEEKPILFIHRTNIIKNFLLGKKIEANQFCYLTLNKANYTHTALGYLNQVINDALQEIHDETLEHIEQILLHMQPDFNRAKLILASFEKYFDIHHTSSNIYENLNKKYQAYIAVCQDISNYNQKPKQDFSEGFKLYFKLKKVVEDLKAQLDMDDCQLVFYLIVERSQKINQLSEELNHLKEKMFYVNSGLQESLKIDSYILNLEERIEKCEVAMEESFLNNQKVHEQREMLLMSCAEKESRNQNLSVNSLHKIEEFNDLVNSLTLENKELKKKIQDLKDFKPMSKQLLACKNNFFLLFQTKEVIFNLYSLGILSAFSCLGLMTAIFLGQLSLTVGTSLAVISSGISFYSFFVKASEECASERWIQRVNATL